MQRLGIDIGGSGIKGAPVDLEAGSFAQDRLRIPTPEGGKPEDVARVVAEIVARFPDVDGPVGCTFPAVMSNGVALTAANVDNSWIGTDAQALFQQAAGRDFVVINDADAAGVAEMRFGVGKGEAGVVLMLTLGTGIGSALFVDGALVANTEFGHLEVRGRKAEHLAADSVRERHDLSWRDWAQRLDEVIAAIDQIVWPQLITIGGGVSKKSEKFLPHLRPRARVLPAQLLNDAGIVGAALATT